MFSVPLTRLAKVVNVFAIRQVKQGTRTTRSRIGFTLHSCQYDSSWLKSVLPGEDGRAPEISMFARVIAICAKFYCLLNLKLYMFV